MDLFKAFKNLLSMQLTCTLLLACSRDSRISNMKPHGKKSVSKYAGTYTYIQTNKNSVANKHKSPADLSEKSQKNKEEIFDQKYENNKTINTLYSTIMEVAEELYPNKYTFIVSKLLKVMISEIVRRNLKTSNIEEEMQNIEQSILFNAIIKNVPRHRDEIFIIFTKVFGDSTPLAKEIIQNERYSYLKTLNGGNCLEELNAKYKCTIGNIIKIRKQITELKKRKIYKGLEYKNCRLSDNELLAIIYYSNSDFNSIFNTYSDFSPDGYCTWKYLYSFVRSGVDKIYRQSCRENNHIRYPKYLYNGNLFKSIKQLIDEKIPLKFTSCKQKAIADGKNIILIIIDPKIGLAYNQLIGADISWIVNNNNSNTINKKYNIMTESFHNFTKMSCNSKIQNGFNSNINVYKQKTIPPANDIPIDHPLFFDKRFKQIKNEIIKNFKFRYNECFAIKLLQAFKKVINEEQFDEIETIRDDLSDYKSSAILESIYKDIGIFLEYCKNEKGEVAEILQNIVNSNKGELFSIKKFTFVVTQKNVNTARELLKRESLNFFFSFGLDYTGKINGPIAEDKSLHIAKAVDLKNGYPILKWLLDSFSRDFVIGHKKLYQSSGVSPDIYDFNNDRYTHGYNPTTWWLDDSVFCKYIQYKNAKMALPLMTAVQALSKRALTQMNFNSRSCRVIHDSLNDFIKYTFASWGLAYELTKMINVLPCQIDFLIIPQLIKPCKINFHDLGLISDEENDNDILSELNLNFVYSNSKNQYNKMYKNNCNEKVQYPLWDLEQYLQKDGYKKNVDYWSDYLKDSFISIKEKMNDMISVSIYDFKKTNLLVYRFLFETKLNKIICYDIINIISRYIMNSCWRANNTIQNKRYIFIIDRRNPKNLKQQNMGYVEPKYFSKDWLDKIYLIKQKNIVKKTDEDCELKKDNESIEKFPYDIISKEVELTPEALFEHSKEFLFPNTEDAGASPIGILDSLNGYKFALSYHLLGSKSANVYSYTDSGSHKFKLEDIKWLWTRYFCKINEKEQELNGENISLLIKYINDKELQDYNFDKFYKQCSKMELVYGQ